MTKPTAWFTPEQQQALQDFWSVYQRHYDAISKATLPAVMEHPEFAALARSIPPEVMEQQGRESRVRLERAIGGEWAEYEEVLRGQGQTYATMGISIGSWHFLIRVFQRVIIPLLIEAYGDAPERLAGALVAMEDFIDRVMVVIGESYINAKERAIEEQRARAEESARALLETQARNRELEAAAARAALRQSEERMRALVDGVRDHAILMLDAEGRVTSWNPGAERLKGYSTGEILGKHISVFYLPDDVAAGRPERVLARAAADGRCEDEGPRVRKDGSSFWANVVVSAVRDERGALQGFTKITRDFSDRKRAADELSELNRLLGHRNEELDRATRAKSDFLAMMSHELRTPLNSIIGFSEILVDGKFGPLAERQARYLRNVHESGQHLLRLINDLLDLSKIEAGRVELATQACAPRRFAIEAAATLQPLAEGRRIAIALDPPEAPPVPAVAADPMRLKQVLYNLLSNAIKFSLPGSVIKVTAEATTGGRVRVTVRDGGPGISAEDLARLFVPFHQLDNARQSGGTGLGLALAKQLVELMGGTIGVQSTLGQGSSFYFELPVDAGAAEAPEGPRPTEAPLVMVVDDDPASREIIEVALQGSGYRTLAVANGEQAIVEARRLRPDLITLDVFLPTIDGWDVLRLLGSDPSTIGVPVVMVTISSDRQKAFSLGAIEHLVKPITRNDLLSALSRHGFTARLARQAVRVLVVDDDPKQLELMHSELSPRGFEVQLANGGRAGLDLARTTPTDLILLDLLMPDLSGIEVVEALKSDERTRATPIILVTAADLSSSDRARLRGDVEAVLAKGITTTEMLVGEIDRVLRL